MANQVSPIMIEVFAHSDWHRPPRTETAGKLVIAKDVHGVPFWYLNFHRVHKVVGEALYYYYVPLPRNHDEMIEWLATQVIRSEETALEVLEKVREIP